MPLIVEIKSFEEIELTYVTIESYFAGHVLYIVNKPTVNRLLKKYLEDNGVKIHQVNASRLRRLRRLTVNAMGRLFTFRYTK